MNTPELPSLEELLASSDAWRQQIVDVDNLSKSRKYAIQAKYKPEYKQLYLWIIELKQEGVVVGQYCSQYQKHYFINLQFSPC